VALGEECPQDLAVLLRKMLEKDPDARITATAILSNSIASQTTTPSDAGSRASDLYWKAC
jgi:serine/threonine protein kinase